MVNVNNPILKETDMLKAQRLVVMNVGFVLALISLAGCQAVTAARNNFTSIELVISPEAKSQATIENFEIFRGFGLRDEMGFRIKGLVKAPRDCKSMLALNFSVLSTRDIVVLNTSTFVQNYAKDTKAKFEALAHVDTNIIDGATVKQVTLTKVSCL